MSFDEYVEEIRVALDRWLDAVVNNSRGRASELKEDAEDIIGSAKEHFPKRREVISAVVQSHISQRLEK